MWPKLSTINKGVYDTITTIDNKQASQLNVWVRLFSGVGKGLVLVSNPDTKLFAAAGEAGIYGFRGNSEESGYSGTLGYDWYGNPVNALNGRSLRPSPMVTSMEFTEGEDQISRTGKISLKVFSLEQLEAIQQYFMEPGYSVFADWGWNTNEGARGLTRVKTRDENGNPVSPSQITHSASHDNLLQPNMIAKRTTTKGQYDSFLGFIVGGTVSGGGETFDITIEMRGTPQLPTYLQSHEVVYEKTQTDDGKDKDVNTVQTVENFGPSDFEKVGTGDTDTNAAKTRRFATMFNELPNKRKIATVKSFQTSPDIKYTDFINFDNVVQKSINAYTKTKLWGFLWKVEEEEELTLKSNEAGTQQQKATETFSIDRSKLFSNKQYIRFETAIKILNENGGLSHFKVGDTELSVKLDVSNVKIGAFPNIFSTKSDIMIIPGTIPDFSKYAFSTEKPDYSNFPTIDNNINGISFTQTGSPGDGHKDSSGYWGYLKNLYINLEMFEQKITQPNKNIREIILDILNSMSSAVNGFWDFQIVEGDTKNGNIVYTVIDRNWVGEKPEKSIIRTFYHDGEQSRFLDASLDIDIPAEKANQIISSRLGVDTGGQIAETKVNSKTFFSNKADRFMLEIQYAEKLKRTEIKENTDSKEANKSNPSDQGLGTDTSEQPQPETLSELRESRDSNLSKIESNNQEIAGIEAKRDILSQKRLAARGNGLRYADPEEYYRLNKEIDALDSQIRKKKTENSNLVSQNHFNAYKLNKAAVDEQLSALEDNIKKIEILPNPEVITEIDVGSASLQQIIQTPSDAPDSEDVFNKSFRIYTYDDTNLFDTIKKKKLVQKENRLSVPLPIKYSFSILGNSGLQRGDMFNVIGIPKKYRDYGLFQINEVTHTIEGMMWKTRISGLYRQTQ